MNRWHLAVVLLAVSAQFCPSPSKQSLANLPKVSISLPGDIPSETVQIRYLMVGPFGGYGGLIEPLPNQSNYEIDASTQSQATDSIKILVYATGCKIQSFDLNLTRVPNPKERFACELLPQIRIDGEIPSYLMRHENAERNVSYTAFWGNRFFCIADGFVTEFPAGQNNARSRWPFSRGHSRLQRG